MIKLPFIRSWCNLWIESYKLISMTNDCQIFYSHLFCRARKILLLSEDNELFFEFVPYAVSEIGKERAAGFLPHLEKLLYLDFAPVALELPADNPPGHVHRRRSCHRLDRG